MKSTSTLLLILLLCPIVSLNCRIPNLRLSGFDEPEIDRPDSVIVFCENVEFSSNKDKDHFGEWIKELSFVKRFFFGGDKNLYLIIRSGDGVLFSDEDEIELQAFFDSYTIKMKQIKIFLNKKNYLY